MLFFSIAILFLLVMEIHAAILRTFLHESPRLTQYSNRFWGPADQSPIGHGKNGHGSPLVMKNDLPIHTVNLSIGTPPQSFSLALDLVEGYVLVPSSKCDYDMCDNGFHRYNSSRSSTYVEIGAYESHRWGEYSYSGFLSQDTIHISDLSIPRHLFEEWTSNTCSSIGCIPGGNETGFDGVLGLNPPWNSARNRRPNTLSLLLSQDLLASSIFSIAMPHGSKRPGELLFGATNPSLYTSPLITLPVVNKSESSLSDLWSVSVTHVTYNTGSPLRQDLPSSYVAVIDSAIPWLILPAAFARNVTKIIAPSQGPWFYSNVPCSSRAYLPTLTFGLGPNGDNFTVSAFEYTIEAEMYGVGLVCVLAIYGTDDFGWPGSILLGSPFLKTFYGVFDMDQRTVGLAPLKK